MLVPSTSHRSAGKLISCVALALLTLLNESYAADTEFRWLVHENAEQTWGLSYAHPESDVGLLWIWCKAMTGEITIAPGLTTSGIRDGERGTILLAAPARTISIEGEASFSEASGQIEISASLPQPHELAGVFKKQGLLRIKIPGNHTMIPLDRKAQSAFGAFTKHCPSLKSSA